MDIAYLQWLQGIREALPVGVETFFVMVSAFAASKLLIVVPCLFYWCLNKRVGQLLLFSNALGSLCNQLIKNSVCCYRPWVRDATLRPSAAALPEATGYSFPSGHTQTVTSLFAPLGWWYRREHPVLLVASFVIVLLVGFSRNFLGVHTPQDVAVAVLEGVIVMFASERLLRWVEAVGGRDALVLAWSLVGTVVFMAYVFLRPYPADYDASGALLVDPAQMQVDCFKAAGFFSAAVLGWFLERRYLGFKTGVRELGWKRIAFRFVTGLIPVLLLLVATLPLKSLGLDERLVGFVTTFPLVLGAAFVGPLVFCAVERRFFKEASGV